MIKTGDILDRRYEIEGKIGQGGMSYVYRAKDLKLDRIVAIKMLKEECAGDEEFLKKFRNEARSAANLTHPNIVAAYDAVDEGKLHYIVMELVEGITLKNYIARKGRLSNKETIGISLQAAEGIAAAHKKGIIHRDIKPQNLIISKDGKVKVADFGIARAVSQDTINSSVVGSVHYIAPEQARSGETDERSDIYSLGICMYEMITGRLPFKGENTVNVVMAHLSEAMVPPVVYNDEIYPALNDIIIKATKKEPRDRYQTATELIADLKHCVNEPEGHFVKLFDTEDRHPAKADQALADQGTEEASEKDHFQEAKAGDSIQAPEQFQDMEAQENAEQADEEAQTQQSSAGDTTIIIRPDKDGIYEPDERSKRIRKLSGYGIYGVIGLLVIILLIVIADAMSTEKVPEEAVQASVSQAESMEPEEDEPLDITVEIQPEQLMPNILGQSVDQAAARLQSYRVSIDSSNTDYSDVYYEGMIIDQDPEPGEILVSGETVHVTVSLGTRLNYTLSHLSGKTPNQATTELSEVGVSVAETRAELSEDVAAGLVTGYELMAEGTSSEVTEGSQVRLIISLGSESLMTTVPKLLGYSEEQARYILNQAGLTLGSISEESSDEYTEGQICRQSLAEGEQVQNGSSVDVVISSGRSELGAGLSSEYYYGSIDTVCQVGHLSGPADAMKQIMVYIRLRQRVDGAYVYTTLEEAKPVAQGTVIPVSFRNIRGAYGVGSGEIEVLNANTGDIYQSTTIIFSPLEG